MKIIDNDSHYWLVKSAHSDCPTSAGCSNYSTEYRISMDKMHLKIVEETEWDAAGEVRDPSCPKHYNSLFWALS